MVSQFDENIACVQASYTYITTIYETLHTAIHKTTAASVRPHDLMTVLFMMTLNEMRVEFIRTLLVRSCANFFLASANHLLGKQLRRDLIGWSGWLLYTIQNGGGRECGKEDVFDGIYVTSKIA